MQDVNNILANAASEWRAEADNLERMATLWEADAARRDAMLPGFGREPASKAEAARNRAGWLRLRAGYADRGQCYIDASKASELTAREGHLRAVCARHGRIVAPDPRELRAIDLGNVAG